MMMKSAILSSFLVICIIFINGFPQAESASAKIDGKLTVKEAAYLPEDELPGVYSDEDALALRRYRQPARLFRPQYYVSDDDYLGENGDEKRSMSMLRLGKRRMSALRLGRK